MIWLILFSFLYYFWGLVSDSDCTMFISQNISIKTIWLGFDWKCCYGSGVHLCMFSVFSYKTTALHYIMLNYWWDIDWCAWSYINLTFWPFVFHCIVLILHSISLNVGKSVSFFIAYIICSCGTWAKVTTIQNLLYFLIIKRPIVLP